MTIGGKMLETVMREYAARHRVKPGITGWAQVHGLRGELNSVEKLERRTEYDLYYINNWSIWLDLLIIFKTIPIIMRDPTAY
jgi:lipopolysaccharide/colanic/teichoic acid biosynthesis glycosyltransferase